MIWILILAYLFTGVGINGVTMLLDPDFRRFGWREQMGLILLWPIAIAMGAFVSFIEWAGL